MATAAAASALPKLTYFPGRGRAELARLIFAAAEVQYEDVRIPSITEHKGTNLLPFDQVPILEIGELKLAQSAAINRFLARKYGLLGANEEEAAKIDMLYEAVIDLRGQQNAIPSTPEEKKVAETEKFGNETLPRWLGYIEKQLVSNNGGDGFLVGSKLSLADLAVYNYLFLISAPFPNATATTPKLAGLYTRVGDIPSIAAWIKKRPESRF